MTLAADRPDIAGIILAGGQSRRMGRDKAAMDVQGQTFLQRARSLLHAVGCNPVLISGRPDLPGGVPDQQPGAGPAQAMLDCLDAIPAHCKGGLFIPVDMPLLEPEDLCSLISPEGSRSRAWRGHPLPVFVSAAEARPDRQDVRSVKFLLERLEIDQLDLAEERGPRFRNVNTPEDWA
tara:strand:+ start:1591 stop:2124 length:534 start_codon:yes stop_codon:yes gene_type:complete